MRDEESLFSHVMLGERLSLALREDRDLILLDFNARDFQMNRLVFVDALVLLLLLAL